MNDILLNIAGMSCGGCVASVQNILSALPGVQSVDVTLGPGQARVVFDPARIGVDDFVRAINAAGFTAKPA